MSQSADRRQRAATCREDVLVGLWQLHRRGVPLPCIEEIVCRCGWESRSVNAALQALQERGEVLCGLGATKLTLAGHDAATRLLLHREEQYQLAAALLKENART